MKCEKYERDIYLYPELPAAERLRVDAHIQACADCTALFLLVSSTQKMIRVESAIKQMPVNHSRLTSKIMHAAVKEQRQSAYWINSLFIRYAMVAASFSLIVAFGVESLSSTKMVPKPFRAARTVTLTSQSFSTVLSRKKEKTNSLYACAKSGVCSNTLFQTLQ